GGRKGPRAPVDEGGRRGRREAEPAGGAAYPRRVKSRGRPSSPSFARAQQRKLRFIDRFLPRPSETAGRQEPGLLRSNVRVVERGGYFVHSDWSPSGVTDQFLLDAGTY